MATRKTFKQWLLLSLFLLLQCGVQLTAVAGNVTLAVNESRVINTSSTNVYGNSGTETATLAAGVNQITLDQNVEQVVLGGSQNQYVFRQTGNRLNIYDTDGVTLIAKFSVQNDNDGTVLVFMDKTLSVKLATGVMTIGGNALTTTPTCTLPQVLQNGICVNSTITLPPDPGPTATETVPGIDSNHNQVRDEVEIILADTRTSDTSFNQTMALAATIQSILNIEISTESEAQAKSRELYCKEQARSAAAQDDMPLDVLRALIYDTPERKARQAELTRLNGVTLTFQDEVSCD